MAHIESARLYGRAYCARNLYPEFGLLRGEFNEIENTELTIRAQILDKLSTLISLVRGGVFIF